MIQPLIDQPNKITDRDIGDLVTKARIDEPVETKTENQELGVAEPIPQHHEDQRRETLSQLTDATSRQIRRVIGALAIDLSTLFSLMSITTQY